MALKKLNQFNYFDAEGFFSKLKLITVGSTVWKEYGSNVVKGTKLEVVIASDKHRYNSNEGEVVNNMYEKLTVKLSIQIPLLWQCPHLWYCLCNFCRRTETNPETIRGVLLQPKNLFLLQ